MTKFNKANLRCTLRRVIEGIQSEHGFDLRDGHQQVAGCPTIVQVQYGIMAGALRLLSQIDGGWLDDAAKYPSELSEEPTISGKPRRPGSRNNRKRWPGSER